MIVRESGINESTIRSILSKSDEHLEQAKTASAQFLDQRTRNRSAIMVDMEDLLSLWLEDRKQRHMPIDFKNIRIKAMSLFSTLKEKKYPGVVTTFCASNGWFCRFKYRTGLKSLKMPREVTSVEETAAAPYPAELYKTLEENCFKVIYVFIN